MKLTVLVDNNTLIDRYFYGEPGVSYLLEDNGLRVLFDVGYSDAFLRNAQKMNLSFSTLDYLVFSHGHLDHTWGLDPLLKYYMELAFEKIPYKKPEVVAHPELFESKIVMPEGENGSLLSKEKIANHLKLKLSKTPVWLTDSLVYLGEIPRTNDFENKKPIGKITVNGVEQDDYLKDDSALAYKADTGLVIITGCSHSGICNIIEYAKKVTGVSKIIDVIGGFHLYKPDSQQMEETVTYFKKLSPGVLHACHCTGLQSKIALSTVAKMEEVGVGLSLNF
jgi:7,8-dihydropterin-6-yl-methyl-4-(beta-D-ribofuranosyl)aminobenzene 5'-phosphate synthase